MWSFAAAFADSDASFLFRVHCCCEHNSFAITCARTCRANRFLRPRSLCGHRWQKAQDAPEVQPRAVWKKAQGVQLPAECWPLPTESMQVLPSPSLQTSTSSALLKSSSFSFLSRGFWFSKGYILNKEHKLSECDIWSNHQGTKHHD